MPATIDYPARIQEALRQTVAKLLSEVAEDGLPGNHHFVIVFDTTHPGVDIPDWMKEQFPDEMTIVMQNWFENLVVLPDRFSVTLNFNNTPEPMVIPLAALRSFVDPSVEFGLRFDRPGELDGDEEQPQEAPMLEDEDEQADDTPSEGASVISLDKFR